MEKLKDLRYEYRYSCQYMANRLKMSKSYYWQIENDKRRLSYETAIKIADIFKTKPDAIFYKELKDKQSKQ